MSSEIQAIVKWFSDAKPNPTIEDVCVQIGCHYEEVGEMAGALSDRVVFKINKTADLYKSKEPSHLISAEAVKLGLVDVDGVDLLDSLCDQIVTSVGVAKLAGFDIIGALNEVIASNDSKRMPDGSFPLDENGKITKESPNFFKPDLSKFIAKISK